MKYLINWPADVLSDVDIRSKDKMCTYYLTVSFPVPLDTVRTVQQPYVDDGILCITTKNFVQRRIYLSFLATSTRPGWPSQEEEILFCLPLYFFVTPVLGANRSAAAAVSITRTRLIDRSSLAALLYSVRSFTLISRQEQQSTAGAIGNIYLQNIFFLPSFYHFTI